MTLMKGRLKGAKTGHSLLKKKADAMQMKFRSILKKIIEVGNRMCAQPPLCAECSLLHFNHLVKI